jgi:hypothetical protein
MIFLYAIIGTGIVLGAQFLVDMKFTNDQLDRDFHNEINNYYNLLKENGAEDNDR